MRKTCLQVGFFLGALGGLWFPPNAFLLAQTPHRDSVLVVGKTVFQLRPFVWKPSFILQTRTGKLDSTQFVMDFRSGKLMLKRPLPDSVRYLIVSYRTLPFGFKDEYARYRMPAVWSDSIRIRELPPPPEILAQQTAQNPFSGATLQRSGSITRGIVAGNRRDVNIESGFRMQLAGEIAPGVQIEASLSDQNTPIQPEGSTQRLHDIDRMIIALKSKWGQLNLGDFDASFSDSRFARLNRKLQGGMVSARIPAAVPRFMGETKVAVAAATSRGIYRIQQFTPTEGVQGPYRLEGKTGEQFIIVVAGSEKVYINGQKLERGDQLDYVIDYASGEVTFTNRQLITADKRITIEFEYTTNRFSRSLLGAEVGTSFFPRKDGAPVLRVGATVLREADALQFAEELGVSDAELDMLRDAGDDLRAATVSGAMEVSYDPAAGFVHYTRKDTLVAGVTYHIYRPLRSAYAQEMVYRVRFTRVLAGQGDYKRVGEEVNGITYRFVGIGKGDYLPVRTLPRPELKAVTALRAGLSPIPMLELWGDWAESNIDVNRLSQINDEDNRGNAWTAGLTLRPIQVGRFNLVGEFRQQFGSARFETFDRTRDVEYARQWNLTSQNATGTSVAGQDERVRDGKLEVRYGKTSFIRLGGGQIAYGKLFSANREAAQVQVQEIGLPAFQYQIEQIVSRDSTSGIRIDGDWLRQSGRMEWRGLKGRWLPYLGFEQENRAQKKQDLFTDGAFSFRAWKPGMQWQGERFTFGGGLEWRDEKQAAEGALIPASKALTTRFSTAFKVSNWFTTDADLGWRKRLYTDWFKQNKQAQDGVSALAKWNMRVSPFKRAIDWASFYEASTEKSALMQEVYREVLPGQGEFMWVDANKDGLKQVDEFLPAVTRLEGNFVRLLVPSDELRPIINVQTRSRLGVYPQRIWPNPQNTLQKILAAWDAQTVFEITEKTESTELGKVYRLSPEVLRNPDQTLNGRLRFSQELGLFRDRPQFGLSLGYMELHNLTRLAAGSEARDQSNWNAEARLRILPVFNVRINGSLETNQQESLTFKSRNYNILSRNAVGEISYLGSAQFQGSLSLLYSGKANRAVDVLQAAQVWRVPVQLRFAIAQKLQATTSVEWANVRVEGGETSGLAGYELTDGRGEGRSWLWNMTLNYAFSRMIRATFYYDGRTAADAPTVHNFRAQVSATF